MKSSVKHVTLLPTIGITILVPYLSLSLSHCIPLVYLICKCLQLINSLSPGRCSCTFNYVNFNQIEVWCLEQSSKHYQGWMPEDLADRKSTLIRVMAWCPQALTITQISVNQDFWYCMLPLGHNDLISRYTSLVAQVMGASDMLFKKHTEEQRYGFGEITCNALTLGTHGYTFEIHLCDNCHGKPVL